jgi:hypothetical protein
VVEGGVAVGFGEKFFPAPEIMHGGAGGMEWELMWLLSVGPRGSGCFVVVVALFSASSSVFAVGASSAQAAQGGRP